MSNESRHGSCGPRLLTLVSRVPELRRIIATGVFDGTMHQGRENTVRAVINLAYSAAFRVLYATFHHSDINAPFRDFIPASESGRRAQYVFGPQAQAIGITTITTVPLDATTAVLRTLFRMDARWYMMSDMVCCAAHTSCSGNANDCRNIKIAPNTNGDVCNEALVALDAFILNDRLTSDPDVYVEAEMMMAARRREVGVAPAAPAAPASAPAVPAAPAAPTSTASIDSAPQDDSIDILDVGTLEDRISQTTTRMREHASTINASVATATRMMVDLQNMISTMESEYSEIVADAKETAEYADTFSRRGHVVDAASRVVTHTGDFNATTKALRESIRSMRGTLHTLEMRLHETLASVSGLAFYSVGSDM